jgi:hypothetical protein
MNDISHEVIKKRCQFFCDDKRKVHITLTSGMWKRGFIDYVGYDFIMIDETLEGKVPIFFLEMKEVDPYIERGKDGR